MCGRGLPAAVATALDRERPLDPNDLGIVVCVFTCLYAIVPFGKSATKHVKTFESIN